MIETILKTLVYLNDNYGNGDIIGIQLNEDHKGGTVTIKCPHTNTFTRRFRVNLATNTVFYVGRQRNWHNLPEYRK